MTLLRHLLARWRSRPAITRLDALRQLLAKTE